MTEGLIQRETNSEITPPPERVTAGGNGKRWQRSGTSIGRRGEVSDRFPDGGMTMLHISLCCCTHFLFSLSNTCKYSIFLTQGASKLFSRCSTSLPIKAFFDHSIVVLAFVAEEDTSLQYISFNFLWLKLSCVGSIWALEVYLFITAVSVSAIQTDKEMKTTDL